MQPPPAAASLLGPGHWDIEAGNFAMQSAFLLGVLEEEYQLQWRLITKSERTIPKAAGVIRKLELLGRRASVDSDFKLFVEWWCVHRVPATWMDTQKPSDVARWLESLVEDVESLWRWFSKRPIRERVNARQDDAFEPVALAARDVVVCLVASHEVPQPPTPLGAFACTRYIREVLIPVVRAATSLNAADRTAGRGHDPSAVDPQAAGLTFKSAAWFADQTNIPQNRLRQAALPTRRTKRVRKRKLPNGEVGYCLQDARDAWPDDMEKKRRA